MSPNDSAVTLAVVGVLASAVGGLLWVLKFLFTRLLPIMEKLDKHSVVSARESKANTVATRDATKYLKARNGRDSEMHKELIKAVGEIPAQIIETATVTAKALKKTPVQTVDKQTVRTQVVKETNV